MTSTDARATGSSTTTKRPRLDSLTSLRFFAAAFVVVHHTVREPAIVELGYLGVAFFFVLSGVVLTWAGSADHGSVPFYRNRLARIYPLQLVTLLAALVVPLAPDVDRVGTFLQNLTLTQAWTWDGAHAFNWVSWSISCEAFFYLLFPVAIVLLRRLPSPVVAAVLAGTWFLQAVVGYGLNRVGAEWAYFATYDFPPFRFGEFLVGVCLGVLLVRGWKPPRWALAALVGVALLGVGVIGRWTLNGGYQPRGVVASAAVPLVVVILLAAVWLETQGRAGVLTQQWLKTLGEWSFALYMTHILVLRVLADLTGATDSSQVGTFPIWAVLPVLALCVAVSGAAHVLVERPAEKRLRAPRTGDRTAVAGRQLN